MELDANKIAMLARLYQLLARRPELLTHGPQERRQKTIYDPPVPISALDAAMVSEATELDLLCGYAVRRLSQPGATLKGVLDVLGMLTPERVCAMYLALPKERRRLIQRDPVWGWYTQQIPSDVADAQWEIASLDTDQSWQLMDALRARIEA